MAVALEEDFTVGVSMLVGSTGAAFMEVMGDIFLAEDTIPLSYLLL